MSENKIELTREEILEKVKILLQQIDELEGEENLKTLRKVYDELKYKRDALKLTREQRIEKAMKLWQKMNEHNKILLNKNDVSKKMKALIKFLELKRKFSLLSLSSDENKELHFKLGISLSSMCEVAMPIPGVHGCPHSIA